VEPGFGFIATGERPVGNQRYIHIHDGRWLPAAGVTRARPSTFAGIRFATGDSTHIAWVIAAQAAIRAAPRSTADSIATRTLHTRLNLTGDCASGWCPLVVGWVRASDLAVAQIAARPAGVDQAQRWVDVDLNAQTLLAFEGDRPIYATLISTGIGDPGSPLSTPVGIHHIRSKHDVLRMDNLEHTGVAPYAYDVPLAQVFSDGKALHAALWHDRFGHPTSHGCINLAPRDAEWLFDFTEARTNAAHPGTVVRIRGTTPDAPGTIDTPAADTGR
jgi:lipoprotein-anchoring transpeptidase ErfK/SrfK